MPTTRPRHAVTETDPVAAALDDAATRWPEDRDNRARLLLRLIEAGHASINREQQDGGRRQADAVRRTHGTLAGAFGTDYLEQLREDWPA